MCNAIPMNAAAKTALAPSPAKWIKVDVSGIEDHFLIQKMSLAGVY
jgi:hypothetical protein